jgi:hypothetical protein
MEVRMEDPVKYSATPKSARRRARAAPRCPLCVELAQHLEVLLQVCHPDRSDSPRAHDAMFWLLAARRKLERGAP